jgi:hypothetical protein
MNNTRGSITLGELHGKLTMLEIACSRCDRRGLLRLDRPIAEHGAGIGLPVLEQLLEGGLPEVGLGWHSRPLWFELPAIARAVHGAAPLIYRNARPFS